jgi:hypothetical protein
MLFAIVLSVASAGHLSTPEAEVVDLGWTWEDVDGRRRRLEASISRGAVDHALSTSRHVDRDALAEFVVAKVDRWALDLPPGYVVQATADGPRVSLRASAPPAAIDGVFSAAKVVREQASNEWLERNAVMRMNDGALSFDHARLAADAAPWLAPLASALDPGLGPRAFAAQALAFVQSIPYEYGDAGADAGYRSPLAVLAANTGDCDSKTVLFLGLMRAAYPEVDAVVLYPPNHALAGLALPRADGERAVGDGAGNSYVLAEPTGPARRVLGEVGDEVWDELDGADLRRVGDWRRSP